MTISAILFAVCPSRVPRPQLEVTSEDIEELSIPLSSNAFKASLSLCAIDSGVSLSAAIDEGTIPQAIADPLSIKSFIS